MRAARRGRQDHGIRINNDSWLSRQNSIRLYGRLLQAGIDIYEYNTPCCTTKTMVVDGVWATVGTTNFDQPIVCAQRGKQRLFLRRDAGRTDGTTFTDDLRKCVRIELETWRPPRRLARVQEFVAAFLQEQV
jgi:cardiolipin synthase